jgi:hypothetical protein
MQIMRYTFYAAVSAVLLSVVMFSLRPPEGNGWISQGGAKNIMAISLFIFFFSACWFPSMIIGLMAGRKHLTEAQKGAHIFVTIISAIVFFGMIYLIGFIISHHS